MTNAIGGMSADPTGLEARAREELRAHGARRDFAAVIEDGRIRHPTRPCESCGALGIVGLDGREIPLRVRSTTPQRCCAACRGFGYVRMTVEETRVAYREARARGCAALACPPEAFDDLAALWLRDVDDLTPGHWLTAARRLASGRTR